MCLEAAALCQVLHATPPPIDLPCIRGTHNQGFSYIRPFGFEDFCCFEVCLIGLPLAAQTGKGRLIVGCSCCGWPENKNAFRNERKVQPSQKSNLTIDRVSRLAETLVQSTIWLSYLDSATEKKKKVNNISSDNHNNSARLTTNPPSSQRHRYESDNEQSPPVV